MPRAVVAKKIGQIARKKIFGKLASTKERKELVKWAFDTNVGEGTALEDVFGIPGIRRAYVMGSFASKKKAPSDIDIIVKAPASIRKHPTWQGIQDDVFEGAIPVEISRYGKLNAPEVKELLAEGRRRYGPGHKWVRILGVAGVAGGATMLKPKEAQASPAGIITRKATKATIGAISSAAKVLKGMKLQNKTVKDIRKGQGVWRSILFEDGTQMTVEQKYINDLCRARGTQRKMAEFQPKPGDSKTIQALRSVRYHEARVQPFFTRDTTRKLTKEHQARLKQIDGELDPDSAYVLYQNKYFAMPRDYAVHLEGMGILKIMRGTREVKALAKTKGR